MTILVALLLFISYLLWSIVEESYAQSYPDSPGSVHGNNDQPDVVVDPEVKP